MVGEPDPAFCRIVPDHGSARFDHCARHQRAVPVGAASCAERPLGRIKPSPSSILPRTRSVRSLTLDRFDSFLVPIPAPRRPRA
jgi:hypothetical protein